ncbi:MAG: hypothetical protein ACRCXZ_10790 [Patescibacteria group bacterium]
MATNYRLPLKQYELKKESNVEKTLYSFNKYNLRIIPIASLAFVSVMLILVAYTLGTNKQSSKQNLYFTRTNETNKFVANGCNYSLNNTLFESENCPDSNVELSFNRFDDGFKISTNPTIFVRHSDKIEISNINLLIESVKDKKSNYIDKDKVRLFSANSNFGLIGDCIPGPSECTLIELSNSNTIKLINKKIIKDAIDKQKPDRIALSYADKYRIEFLGKDKLTLTFDNDLNFNWE